MKDILQQIQSLREQFGNLLDEELEKEGPSQEHKKEYTELSNSLEDDLKPYANKAAQEVMNKLGIDIGEYVDRINPKEKNNELHQHKYRKVREYAADQLTPWEKLKGVKAENRSLPKAEEREAHKKEVHDIMKQYHTGDDAVAKSIIKGKKKMNDNNSYNEIITKILNLKEDFMNLIEVEGLGQPASDVPPSTNKIKRDKKTKDGKVELVSVEDELFPKDGNAREQFRQKILDVINGMIQGTATLEDLMQIVRAKKNGFMKESLDDQIEKKFKKGEISFDQAGKLSKKIKSMMSDAKQHQEMIDSHVKDSKTNPNSALRDIDKTAFFKSIKRARKNGKISYPPRYKVGKDDSFLPADSMPKRAPQTEDKDKIEASIERHNKKSEKKK